MNLASLICDSKHVDSVVQKGAEQRICAGAFISRLDEHLCLEFASKGRTNEGYKKGFDLTFS